MVAKKDKGTSAGTLQERHMMHAPSKLKHDVSHSE